MASCWSWPHERAVGGRLDVGSTSKRGPSRARLDWLESLLLRGRREVSSRSSFPIWINSNAAVQERFGTAFSASPHFFHGGVDVGRSI